jgi:hypothetical protein
VDARDDRRLHIFDGKDGRSIYLYVYTMVGKEALVGG